MTPEAFWKTYDIGLNAQQRAAVEAVNGPVLLLAVPGSGKTTTLVTRLGYLVLVCGIAPENILTLTYTVSAAADMKDRFCRIFGASLADRMNFRTINGVCALIIASFGRTIGRSPYTLLSDETKTAPLLRAIYQGVAGEYPTESDLKDVRTRIAYIKNMMLTDEEIRSLDKPCGYPISAIYDRYSRQLKERKCMDYDDQMVYARILLLKFPALLSVYRQKYQYLCVDEAQDTSKIQHEIIALLAGETRNLFMVGDEDQSIYGFRAAWPEALLHFQDRYPGAKILLMETNYRSGRQIVAAADSFIRSNILHHRKNMIAGRPSQANIRFITLRGRGAQYTYLAKAAAAAERKTVAAQTSVSRATVSGTAMAQPTAIVTATAETDAAIATTVSTTSAQTNAVLCRDNESLVPLIDLLESQNIPFTLKRSDTSFFSSRVITDIRNIIAFSQNPKDVSLFLQIYYKMSTYLSKDLAQELCREAERRQLTPFEVANKSRKLTESVRKALKNVRSGLVQLRTDKAVDALNHILGSLGYGSYLARAGIRDNKIPILYNIASRTGSASDFVHRLDQLEQFITGRDNPETGFILSTIHASKGLEYDTVYLIDAADGIFPQDMPDNPQALDGTELRAYEEERRLFYVAITRARNNLILFEFGKNASLIHQLKTAMAPKEKPKKKYPGEKVPCFHSPAQHVISASTPEEDEKFDEEGFRAFAKNLSVGCYVVHRTYGQGVVKAFDRDHSQVLIVFRQGISRRFSLPMLYRKHLLRKDESPATHSESHGLRSR